MIKFKWQKPYRGTFKKAEALAIWEDLKKTDRPDINGIHDVMIRRRRNTQQYDVYIKSEKD